MGKKLALHWWILIAMALGVGYGALMARLGWTGHVLDYIKPAGTLFLNLLRMIAVPLVLFSLAAGVAGLNDTAKPGRIGGKSIGLYLGTTAVAIALGLLVASVIRSGSGIALILGVDRPLDLLRTTLNVTGDATVATCVAASEGRLTMPAEAVAA